MINFIAMAKFIFHHNKYYMQGRSWVTHFSSAIHWSVVAMVACLGGGGGGGGGLLMHGLHININITGFNTITQAETNTN